MIHFDVVEDGGDRTLYLEGTTTLVGWIERGRTLQTQHGPKTEWRFAPADASVPASPVTTRGISPAYEAAREYAERLVAS